MVDYGTITNENPYSTVVSSSNSESQSPNARGLSSMFTFFGRSRVVQDISGVPAESAEPQHWRKMSADELEKVSNSNMCAICLEEMDEEEGEIYTIPICQHKFHETCLRRWKKEKATCPVCRGVVPDEVGLTNKHFWIGSRQLTINTREPPQATCFHIFSTILLAPLGILYSLLIVICYAILVLFLFLFMSLFFLGFSQWYAFIGEESYSICGRIYQSVTSIILFPFLFIVMIFTWVCHLHLLLTKLGSYYKKVVTCRCRWSDGFSETVLPTIMVTQDAFRRFTSENQ